MKPTDDLNRPQAEIIVKNHDTYPNHGSCQSCRCSSWTPYSDSVDRCVTYVEGNENNECGHTNSWHNK